MKYIKTNDGRIIDLNRTGYDNSKLVHLDENQLDGGNWAGWYWNTDEYGYEIECRDVDILKQANNIKDLCDAYIITSKQGHIYDSYGDYGYELKEVLPQAREECPDEDWDLYGCILVNGIIKQVAKLNDDKGELELL